jgi:hypothetical protein
MAIGWDKLGDLTQYESKEDVFDALKENYGGEGDKKNNVAANYDFLCNMAIGDIVIVKRGRGELLGYGVITSEYFFDTSRAGYKSCRTVDWKLKGNWQTTFSLVLKTLTDVTQYEFKSAEYEFYYENLMGIMKGDLDMPTLAISNSIPVNQIFYGPPGTGKTYNTILEAAKIIEQNVALNYSEAQTIFNTHLGSRLEFITFHQNYSYEDFIQGLRPDIKQKALSFNRLDGVFTRMVTNALFEYYKVLQQNQKAIVSGDNAKVDLNIAFIEFLNSLKEGQEFETKTGAKIKVDNFTNRQNIEFKPVNGIMSYTVSGDRLIKLYKEFDAITKIKRVQEDIQNAIGGCNTTIYYVALREFISFLNLYKATSTEFDDPTIVDYSNISYLRKKELLSNVSLEDLRTVSETEVPKYVIIIDEINRANISRVFGELITLIEKDKRSHGKIPLRATLPSGESFIVPSNLYIIGTMNTADKSIALLDIALRRRFEFVPMYPNSNSTEDKIVHDAIILEAINKEIISRKGHDFTIGHSYFMGDDYNLKHTIDNKVIPLLLEYFMNDDKEVKQILGAAQLVVEGWPMQYIPND